MARESLSTVLAPQFRFPNAVESLLRCFFLKRDWVFDHVQSAQGESPQRMFQVMFVMLCFLSLSNDLPALFLRFSPGLADFTDVCCCEIGLVVSSVFVLTAFSGTRACRASGSRQPPLEGLLLCLVWCPQYGQQQTLSSSPFWDTNRVPLPCCTSDTHTSTGRRLHAYFLSFVCHLNLTRDHDVCR